MEGKGRVGEGRKKEGRERRSDCMEEREKRRKKGKDSIPLTNMPLYWQEARSSIFSVRRPLN